MSDTGTNEDKLIPKIDEALEMEVEEGTDAAVAKKKRSSLKKEKINAVASLKSINIDEVELLSEKEASVSDDIEKGELLDAKEEENDDIDGDENGEITTVVEEEQADEDMDAEEVVDVDTVILPKEVENGSNLKATETLQKNPQAPNRRVATKIAKGFDKNIKQPIKRVTGIEQFDKWHLCVVVCVLLCLVMVSILPFVLTTMADTEVGVGYSPLAGTFMGGIIKSGGVRTKQWGGTVIRWPRTDQIIQYLLEEGAAERNTGDNKSQRIKTVPRLYCNSKDGLEIEMSTVVHLRIIESEIKRLTQKYGSFGNWFNIVTTQIHSTSLHFCQNVTAFEFQSDRLEVSIKLEALIREELFNRFRADIRRVALINVARPAEFEQGLVDLENGRSIINLAATEREGAVIEAETLLDIASNEVIRIIDTAETNAEVKLILAENVAESLLDRIAQLGDVFERVQTESQLDTTQTLTFIESLLLVNDLSVGIDAPVQLNFKDEL